MDKDLVKILQDEERIVLGELRHTMNYRRLEEIRRLLSLYQEQPPIGSALEEILSEREEAPGSRRTAVPPVIPLGSERPVADVA